MPERVTPLLPVQVDYGCDECGTLVTPSKIPDIGRDGLTLYQCPQCLAVFRLAEKYPRMVYVDYLAWMKDCAEILHGG